MTKLNKTYKEEDKNKLSKKMQFDIGKLYRKDILPLNPEKINFSNYIKMFKKLNKKPKEEEKNSSIKVKKPDTELKVQNKDVDEAILDYIKEKIHPNHTFKPKLPHNM